MKDLLILLLHLLITIAKLLGPGVLSGRSLPEVDRPRRVSLIDRYLPYVLKTLEQHPSLTASRLCAMVRPGSDTIATRLTPLPRAG